MYRTLKAALKCTPETPWLRALSAVILRLRTTFKEDSEMVFGISLRIPGKYNAPQSLTEHTRHGFASELRRVFNAMRLVPPVRDT